MSSKLAKGSEAILRINGVAVAPVGTIEVGYEKSMSPDFAGKLALHLCMQTGYRYLDCLNAITYIYETCLPDDFVSSVRKDFEEYADKMQAARLPLMSFVNGDWK